MFFTFFGLGLGAIIGSFLTVCIHRIPYGRKKGLLSLDKDPDQAEVTSDTDEAGSAQQNTEQECSEPFNIIYPSRSLCPTCNKQLLWWHNIPIISWFLLRGKCHFCQEKISFRYPLVELLSALFCMLSFTYFDIATAIVVYAFCATLIVLSFIDIDYYILPNVITYPGSVIALLIVAINQFYSLFSWPISPDLITAFWGLMAGGGFLFAISEGYFRLRKKVGLGMGDVKLLAMTGILLGPEASLVTIFCGSFLGAIIGALMMLLCKHSMTRPLPFGPYLALGTLLHIFFGPDFPNNLINEYLLY